RRSGPPSIAARRRRAAQRPRRRRTMRDGVASRLLSFGLLQQMVAAARRQRHHRERRMFVARRRKGVPAEHVQVRNVVCLAERIQDAVFWSDAHAGSAHLVDRTAERSTPAAVRVGALWGGAGIGRAGSAGKTGGRRVRSWNDFAAGLAKQLLGLLLEVV